MNIRAMNYKEYEKGAMKGFLDLGYGGITIKGCRLMDGKSGLWLAMPSKAVERNGKTTYQDIVEITKSEVQYITKRVIADLESQGSLGGQKRDGGSNYSPPPDYPDDVPY